MHWPATPSAATPNPHIIKIAPRDNLTWGFFMPSCIPINENISIYEGDDCTLDFVSGLGDISNCTIRLQARVETSSRYSIIDVPGSITDASTGKYSVTFPSDSTLGHGESKPYFYDIKITTQQGSVHTDRYGMLGIEPRTTDVLPTHSVSIYGVDVDKDKVPMLSKARELNFEGSGVTVSTNLQGGVDIKIDKPAASPTLALHFAGIYDDLQSLQDAITNPTENMQAIVISPSEKYYHGVGGSWNELAPVGAMHPTYLGAYDSVVDLESANSSPATDSMAIVGTTAKYFYLYDGSKWEALKHTDLPSLDARVTDAESKISKARSDIVGLQTVSGKNSADIAAIYAKTKAEFDSAVDGKLSQPKADISALQAGQGVLQSNINQKISGVHLEDTEGNSFNDISGIVFDGAEVQDDQGTGKSHVVVKPKITVANGQAPGDVSLTGNAIVLPGSTVTADPNDPSVLLVDIHASSHDGISVGDGYSASRQVKRILFNGHQAFGSGDTAEIHLEFAHFKTMAERDAWSAKFGSHMDFDLVALVDADENGFVSWYRFDSATKSWKDFDAQGVVMSDSDGAIPKNIKTVVFGPGFNIQQAGDQEDAALVTYSGGDVDSSLTIEQDWGDVSTSNKVNAIKTLYPIEVNKNQTGGTPLEGNATLSIDPKAYEAQHGNACLVKLDMVKSIAGQQPHNIYMPEEVVPTGEYFQLNPQKGGVDVQDNTGGDTAATGGQLTEALVKLAFLDNAPDAGTVKAWLEYKDPSDPIDKKILVDVNGDPIAVGKHFNSDEPLSELILAGAFMAKSTQPLKVVIETSFDADSKITLDPVNTMLCLNQFSDGYETSVARIEFLRRAAVQITPAIQRFDSEMLSLSTEISGITQSNTVITPGSGRDTLNEFGLQNLTNVAFSIADNTLTVSDAGSIADFYVDTIIDNTQTRMLRGKSISARITIGSPDGAFEFEAYKWTGVPDEMTQVYSSRSNGSIVLNDGWVVIKGVYVSEQPTGQSFVHVIDFDVPEDANNVLLLVRPSASEEPTTLKLSEFAWGVPKDFAGYAEIERFKMHENHFRFDDTYAEFILSEKKYAYIRYTINNTPVTGNPMPVGKLAKGKAPVEIDNSVNKVPGSSFPQLDGAIKFLKDGEASISKSYNVWNEEGTDNTVTFWDVLIDADGNESKIPESEHTFTIPKHTGAPGVIYSMPAYAIDVETGQRVGGRATSNKADGAYVQTQNLSEYLVQTIVELKELVADASDSHDLINAPIPKANVTDRRVYSLTGNAEQNVIIDIDIPTDVELAEIEVAKQSGTKVTSIKDCEYAYDSSTKKLTVHVGNGVVDGKIYLTFWSAIA